MFNLLMGIPSFGDQLADADAVEESFVETCNKPEIPDPSLNEDQQKEMEIK